MSIFPQTRPQMLVWPRISRETSQFACSTSERHLVGSVQVVCIVVWSRCIAFQIVIFICSCSFSFFWFSFFFCLALVLVCSSFLFFLFLHLFFSLFFLSFFFCIYYFYLVISLKVEILSKPSWKRKLTFLWFYFSLMVPILVIVIFCDWHSSHTKCSD